jgi:mono/diheme cytochrome c family protein
MNTIAKAGVLVLVLAGGAEWLSWRSGEVATQQAAEVAAQQSVEDGAALFRTKGCITCHAHAAVERGSNEGVLIGPNLTNYRNDPAWLRRWLDDPAAVRPVTQTPNEMPNQMPDLDLSSTEIEQLIAFLNREKE